MKEFPSPKSALNNNKPFPLIYMKLKSIIFISLISCIFNAFALSTIELRCELTMDSTHTEMEFYKNLDGLQITPDIKNKKNYHDKYLQYIKVIFGDNDYFKIEFPGTIYSNKEGESQYNSWNKKEMEVKAKNYSNENTILVVADMYSTKYGEMRVHETITIDRTSGAYEMISEMNDTMGKIKKESKANYIMKSHLYSESKGNCEKFNRKF